MFRTASGSRLSTGVVCSLLWSVGALGLPPSAAAQTLTNPGDRSTGDTGFVSIYGADPLSGFTGTLRTLITISSGFVRLTAPPPAGVTAPQGYSSAEWLTGTATQIVMRGNQADLNTALRTLQGRRSGGAAAAINIIVTADGDGSGGGPIAYNPANNHYYAIEVAGAADANQAREEAAAKTHNGYAGYLATITSAAENTFIVEKLILPAMAFIGASDTADEGAWKWITGPEADTQFWSGGPSGSGGATVGGRYANWLTAAPDNVGDEDFGLMVGPGDSAGRWSDAAVGVTDRYIIEYGGMPGDARLQHDVVDFSIVVAPGGPVPTVSAISPSSGPAAGGTAITITGTNFTAGATITVGGAATNVVVVSSTTMTAVTPANHPGRVDVTVTTTGGSGTLPGAFRFIAPVPRISSLSPSGGPTVGGTRVTLRGTDFVVSRRTRILFGGVDAREFEIISSSEAVAVSPPSAAGPVDVTIINGGGEGSESFTVPGAFTYVSGRDLTVRLTGRAAGRVVSAPAGISCGDDCVEPYPTDLEVTLTAVPYPDASFAGWGGDADCADGE